MNDKIFIFGHKKPDTDSVTSAIALSYLKNKLGFNTEPRVLGDLNKETLYALKYFNIEKPKYLDDVKLQLKDIDYHKDFILNENESIYDGYKYMLSEGLTGIPIVTNNNKFAGLITMKDLIHSFISDTDNILNTSYNNLLKVLNAKEICRFDEELNTKILVAGYKSTTFMDKIKLDKKQALIIGDRHSIIEYAINSSIKLIIITNDSNIKDEHIELAKKNHVNIIRTPYDSFHTAKLITLSNYIKTMVRSYNTTNFEDSEFVDTVLDINEKLRHTNYPVVDKYDNCLGLLRITDLTSKHPKKVILVDHNEKLQTVDGIDEAEIVEIVDHHNLGSITTNQPINFRNMSVGSTNTIIYTLFKENNIEIPREIAGMMLSGILSDTLILKSPTATDKDREAVKVLAKIAEVDYEVYGLELLKAGTSLDGMSIEDVLYNDYKLYTVGETSFACGQFFTMNFEDINKDLDKYLDTINEVAISNNYGLVCLYVTDIIKNGSYILFSKNGQNIINKAYDREVNECDFIDGCVSRKKNVVPLIMDAIEN